MKVKICGITNKEDAVWALNYGADYIGINLWKESKRHVSLATAALKPDTALATVSVTFSVPTSTSASCERQRNSALLLGASKPSSTRLLSLDDNSARQGSTQWWLVRIRPSGETNEAVQFVSRIVDSRTRSSQAGVISAPYCRFIALAGKLSNVHIPSSAIDGTTLRHINNSRKIGENLRINISADQ